ncbi:permease-like cell division protein FtsX [Nocardiopsis valliformis]|uniref:permease-like cell division protein FtsX n=1 Tax=Nocardiopsis valliformis TaxID=239974 RepID=UPI00034DF6D8|nr:permease-like cell division protein FtsX [Nocardiopsis valliformis]
MSLTRTLTALTAAPLLLVAATGCGLIPVQHSNELTVVTCAEESTEPVCVENGPATEEEREAVEELLDQTAEVVVYRFLTEVEVFEELTEQGEPAEDLRPGDFASRYVIELQESEQREELASALAEQCGVGEVFFAEDPADPDVTFPGSAEDC